MLGYPRSYRIRVINETKSENVQEYTYTPVLLLSF